MANEEWETIAVGPTGEEWETVANGAASPATSQGAFPASAGSVAIGGLSKLIPAYGDEIVAGGSALLDALTGGPGYDERLAQIRSAQKDFEKAALPGTSTALDIGSALLMPFGRAKQLAAGRSAAGNILRTAILGAGGGGVYGYGTGEGAEDRLLRGAVGTAAGGVAGVAGSGLVEGGSALLRTKPGAAVANYVADTAKRLGAEEAGAVLPAVNREVRPESEGPLVTALMKYLREYTPEELRRGVSEMGESIEAGVPVWASEALPTESMKIGARYYANSQGGRDVFQAALKARRGERYDRLTDAFDTVGRNLDPEVSGATIQKAAADVVKAAKAERTKAASPVYKKAFEEYGEIRDEKLNSLIEQSDLIKSTIREVKRTSEYKGLASNNLRVLDKVKQRLDDLYEKKAGTREAGDIWAEREKLVQILDEGRPLYPQARAIFEEQSKNLAGLNNTALKALSNLQNGEFSAAGDKLFKLQPAQIQALKDVLGKNNEESLRDVARSYVQEILDKGGENRNILLNKVFNSKRGEDQLKTILGEGDFAKLKAVLQFEQQIAEGEKAYFMGSSTASNLQEAANQGSLLRALLGSPRRAVGNLAEKLSMPRDQVFQREMATVLSNPELAQRLISQSVIPQVERLGAGGRLANALINVGQPAAERVAGPGAASNALLAALQTN